MTTVKEKMTELFKKHPTWCGTAKKLLKDESADMYNSSRRPDVWAQGLAYMNLPKARDLIAAVVQQVAGDLDACELKTKMLTVTASMTEQQYTDLVDWAEPLRNGEGPFTIGQATPTEFRLLYSACKFLRDENLPYIKAPMSYFMKHEDDKPDVTTQQAFQTVADFNRSQITLEEWRGSYE
jgi:hypothetical protein